MQAATGMENEDDRSTVICDCGAEYQTRVIALGERDVRQQPLCEECTGKLQPAAGETRQTVLQLDSKWRNLCPARYQLAEVAKLPCGRKVASVIEEWRPNAMGHGLLLVGPTRSGKTMAAWNGLRHIMRSGVSDVAAINDATIGVRYGDALGRGEGMDYIDRLVLPALLFWDDFGKAKPSHRYSELAYAVIETRMAALRPMIITTQLDPDAIVAKLGEYNGSAIVERLQECCQTVPV